MLGGPGEQHEQQQRAGQQHVDVGHHPHALVDAGHRDDDRRPHHQRDQADLNPLGVGNAEQVIQARVEVQHAKTHVGTQTEHSGDDAEAVYRVTNGAVDAFTDQRVQRRAQGQRQVMPVGEVGQRHADKGEHAPAMQAPVQEQDLHPLARRIRRAGLALGRLQHMGQGLGHAEEKQRDADPGGEQHAGPGQITEFGLVVVGTEFDLAVAR
ncbi:hypothetical protein D3C76_789110 [compost metagenome]